MSLLKSKNNRCPRMIFCFCQQCYQSMCVTFEVRDWNKHGMFYKGRPSFLTNFIVSPVSIFYALFEIYILFHAKNHRTVTIARLEVEFMICI